MPISNIWWTISPQYVRIFGRFRTTSTIIMPKSPIFVSAQRTRLPRKEKRGIMVGYKAMSGAMTRDTTDISFIRIFSEGPDVSLKGSPTVSPTTAALWASEPFS